MFELGTNKILSTVLALIAYIRNIPYYEPVQIAQVALGNNDMTVSLRGV